ncbi:hypothetical protein [Escherichia coli]|uniref:hypothetical protein n=1 Tax=Escherichia coli TaxID=562 RepID=UPI002FCCD47D
MPKPQKNAFSNWQSRKQKRLWMRPLRPEKWPRQNRDMFLATCRTEEGRKQFAEYTKGAQPLVNNDKPSQGKDKPAQTLTDAELAMCRSMGITGEEFLAAKPKQENN